ncbi:MAG: SDR family oxidoreductase [Bacteroidia bacterium]|nr:SDR family oxidoreductase [Bacteroidia bacterium]
MNKKTVVITGGSSGIGKACAMKFARMGFNVAISGRDEERLIKSAEEIKKINTEVLPVAVDVGKEDDCRRLTEETIRKFGRMDVLINNAGISMRAAFSETELAVLKQLMNTNFWGAVYCTKFALPYLLKNKGTVAGISSIAGKAGLPGRTGYSASKFALEGFLESLRIENLNTGLHVLTVCPGFTESNIRNMALSKDGTIQGESPREEGKLMKAEMVADRIYDAVIKRKREIVLTTEGKLTVWLKKFFPSWLDTIIYKNLKREPGAPF